jgi:hypothetical protein
MNSENIRYTDTNSADDSKGKTWGLDGNLFWFLIGGAFVSVVIMLMLFSAAKWSFGVACLVALLPLGLVLVYVFAFKQGKPPRYDVDCLEYVLRGKGFGPAAQLNSHHPLRSRYV